MSDNEDNNDQLSSPRLPEQSVGSSVSTSMQEEYEDLLRYTVVIPQYDTKAGPQVLENGKGLFMTTEFQVKLKQHLEQQKLVVTKFEEKAVLEKLEQVIHDEEEKEKKEQEKEANRTQDDTMDGMSTSINSNLTFTDSFSPQRNGLLKPANGYNSAYYNNNNNLDTNFTTITNESTTLNENNNTSYTNESDNLHLNLNNNNNNNNSTNTNDINPRKHSPVPISPPTNIDYDATADQSFEILQNRLQQKNQKQQQHHHHNKEEKQKHDLKTTTSLDKWFKEFKTHIITELEKSRLQLMEQEQKRLIDEKEKQAAEILKLQHEIGVMRENLGEHERNTERKDNVIANLSKALEKQREKSESQRVMMELKIKKLENSREIFTSKIAEKFHDYRTKSKIFLNWHTMYVTRHKMKVEKACKKKAEEVCVDLANQYQDKIRKLEEELRRSKDEIDKYKIEMGRYEENMKRALMRGVCALNMEAMSIFSDDLYPQQQQQQQNGNMSSRKSHHETYQQQVINEEVTTDSDQIANEETKATSNNQNEQLFKSSQNSDQSKGFTFNKSQNSSLKNIIVNCEPRQTLGGNSKIPTIIVENSYNNDSRPKTAATTSAQQQQQQQRISSSKSNVKAKVNTNVNASQPLRSIIIERHTDNADESNKVYKYLPTTTATATFTAGETTSNRIAANTKKNLLVKCSN